MTTRRWELARPDGHGPAPHVRAAAASFRSERIATVGEPTVCVAGGHDEFDPPEGPGDRLPCAGDPLPDAVHIPHSMRERALAALHVALTCVDERGTLLWTNRAARQLLEGGAGTGALWAAVRRAAKQLCALGDPARPDRRARPVGEIRLEGADVRLYGTYLGVTPNSPAGIALVALEHMHTRALSDAALRERYGLTAQEVRVARLLAEGRSNSGIATALGVSPNTARIHTERVRRKLGVTSRAQVAALLTRG